MEALAFSVTHSGTYQHFAKIALERMFDADGALLAKFVGYKKVDNLVHCIYDTKDYLIIDIFFNEHGECLKLIVTWPAGNQINLAANSYVKDGVTVFAEEQRVAKLIKGLQSDVHKRVPDDIFRHRP